VLRIPTDELPPPTQPSPRKAYLILPGDQVYWLVLSVVNIGRRGDNQLVLSDLQISRNHAQVRLVHGQFVIFDLDSTSGTFVNGNPVREHALRPGDVITLGSIALIYGEDVPDTPTAGNQTAAMIDK
jgi:pSer/pThr/pTyr-binding forkhead associated (FHA) protein